MFRNYLTIALRNLLRHRGFSAINITGLGVGMACSILIFLWVRNEISYNRFNEKAVRLFRLVQTQHYVTGPLTTTCMPGPVAKDLLHEVPEIKNAFMYFSGPGIVNYEDKFFMEDVRLADPAMWDMFTMTFLKGERAHVFDDVNSIVITDKIAEKYFPDEDPLGKVLKINNEHSFKVTGVIQETPLNSTFRFDLCIPFEYIERFGFEIDKYGWNNYYSYVELIPGADYRQVNKKIKDFLMVKSKDPDQKTDPDSELSIDLFLFPLKDIYLHSVTGKGGNITYVYLFSIIAVFIVNIACINFMNLSTARAGRRSREIGLRKAAGATRSQIILQFIGESMLVTLLAFVVAILLVHLFLPGFNALADKSLSIDWSDPVFIAGLACILIFTGIMSGSYPALYLSSMEPILVLKNAGFKGRGNLHFRRILVVFQFTLSVALIICTIVVYRQLAYLDRKDPGMETENVIYVEMMGKTAENYTDLKNEFYQDPAVVDISRAGNLPFEIGSNSGGFNWEGRETNDEVLIGFGFADVGYVKTLGMKMTQGRFFEEGYGTDTISSIILNEKAVQVMGLEDPIGKWVSWGDAKFSVIGVIQDFHFLPMTEEIGPLTLINAPGYCNTIFVKISSDNLDHTISFLRDAWEKINPGFPFDYKFLDDAYAELYVSEDRLGEIFRYFSILAVIISCLGLFGLAAFMAEQRTREIGIRKVLGATTTQIVSTLSVHFLKWVLMANILAWPLAYYFMDRWLDGYAYHTRLSPWIFVLATSLSLLIAVLAVGFQTIRAAYRAPVETLKYE